MQKTIYVKDQAEWDEVKQKADESGMTVSRYLLGSIERDLIIGKLDWLESKIDKLLNERSITFVGKPAEPHEGHPDSVPEENAQTFGDSVDDEPMVPIIDESRNVEQPLGMEVSGRKVGGDAEILAEGQKKLDAMREKLERKKGETNAAWQIRKRVFERGAK